jgi:4-hydroxy-tetrahydrodipicolinate synthase
MLTAAQFRGPWAGLPVPWTEDDCFDESTFRADVAACCRAGIPGVYTAGTSGEFYAMEFEEWLAVSRAAVQVCREHGTPVMLGCTATWTGGAVRRAAVAAELGADAIQVALPFWMEVADDQVIPFFAAVAAAAPGLAFSVYETQRAKKALTLAQHQALKEAIPAYAMVKANAGTMGVEPDGCAALSSFVSVFVGETQWAELAPLGAAGCCSATVYWNPGWVLRLWEAVERGDWDTVTRSSEPLAALHAFLGERYAPLGFTDTAYDRMGGRAFGFLKSSLRSRGPYISPTQEDVDDLRQWCLTHFPEFTKL